MSTIKTSEDFWASFTQQTNEAEVSQDAVENATDTEIEVSNDVVDSVEIKDEETAPVVEEPTVQETEDGDISDWFTEDEVKTNDKQEVSAPSFDFSSLSKAINKEIKSVEELTTYVKSLEETNSKLKVSSEEAFKDVPNDLREAIEYAKNGGDYREFLQVSEIDYDQVDTTEIVLEDIRQYFPEGEEGDEAFRNYVDNLPKVELQMRANQVRNYLKQQQAAKKQQIVEKAKRDKDENDSRLRNTLNGINKIADFKLEPSIKEDIFKTFSNGKLMKEMFYGADGKIDFNKAIESYFKFKYFDKIQKYYSQRITNQTKKDIIATELNNSSVKKTQSVPTPENKPSSGLDLYMEYLKTKRS